MDFGFAFTIDTENFVRISSCNACGKEQSAYSIPPPLPTRLRDSQFSRFALSKTFLCACGKVESLSFNNSATE